MPVFTLHTFNDAGTIAMDTAVANGNQNGLYLNGAVSTGDQAVLDGVNDIVKIQADPTFQMDRGTLNIQFTLSDAPLTSTQTVLSRDSVGLTDGGYHIDILADGSVLVSHETPTGTQTFGTAPGFASPGDEVNLTYSWDQGGTGGFLEIDNLTTGGAFDQPVPNTLTMDQGAISQPWFVGAGQSASDPAALNNINQYFSGQVAVFSLSDTVDNQPDNNTPDAQPDTATTGEGDLIVIPVLDNDTDPNGDPLTVTGGSAPNGTVTVNPDGTISYQPNPGFTGTDTISYTITDPSGNTDSSFVTVTVVPDGAAPDGIVRGTDGNNLIDTAYIDPFDTDRVDANDALLPGDAPNDDRILAGAGNDTVLAGLGDDSVDAGSGNDLVTAGLGDDTVYGGLGTNVLNGNEGNDSLVGGAGTDTLNGGIGNDTLLAGGNPGVGDVLNGEAGNDVLVGGGVGDTLSGGAGNDSITGNGATVIYGDDTGTADLPDLAYPGLHSADTDPNNNRDVIQAGPNGTLVYGGDDADTVYGGMAGDTIYGGVDSDSLFGYEGDDSIIGDEGSDTILGGDGDDTLDGDGLAPAAPDLPDATDLVDTNNIDDIAGGAGNDVIYGRDDNDHMHGDAGNDTLYGGNDDDTLTGGVGNDLLDGGQGRDAMTGNADRDTFVNVGAGDTVDGSGTGDDYDTLDLRGLGPLSVVYDPLNAENGTVTFLDGAGNPTGSMGFVEIENVLRDDTPPTAGPDVATTPEDTAVTIPVLGNDSDPDGQPLTVTTATAPNGTVVINPDGTLTYTPNPDYNGPDTITYTVTDPDGNTDSSTVAVTVTPVEDAPAANPDTATTPEDTAVTIPVLGNDSDPDGQPLTVTTATAPNGTVVINPDGTLTYTPNPDYNGPDTITYTVTDPDGNTDSSTVGVTVTPMNDAPEANPDTSSTPLNTPVTFAVLGNDTDVDGDTLTITGTPTSADGTVVVNADGTLTFTPTTGFTGAAVVNYNIVDEEGLTDTTTWTITVDDAETPSANPDVATTPEDTPVTIPVLLNDSDPQGQPLAVTSATAPNGTVVINPDGTLTYTPDPDFTGPDTITYTVTDPDGNTDTTTVAVTVTPDAFPDGYVRGTTGGDLIDINYVDPFDTDQVDDRDAILPGDAPNDDRILAGAGNDTVNAGTGDDSVEGGTGDDILVGRGGVDTLIGDDGDDTLYGQTGNDVLYGGDGNDDVRGGTGNDLIDTSGGSPLPLPDQDYPGLYPADTDPNNDLDTVYGGSGDDTIRTGDDADVIAAGYGDDSVDGGIDNDTIWGNQGRDTIIGGEGADVIDGGWDEDLIYGGYGPGVPDTVNIRDDQGDLRPGNGNDSIRGGMGNDTIYGLDDNDTIDGGQDNDYIDGGIDEDVITGNTGNDTIVGGQGSDTLSGGNDRDTFLITAPTDGLGDVIDGNEGGDDFDTLDLRGSGPHRIVYAADNPENGVVNYLDTDGNVTGTLTFTNIENVIPCFTPGTLIATPKGEVLVEDLKAGDRIITRDNGIQEIRWVGAKQMGYRDLFNNPHLKPVLIRQGSLGNGLPERDMTVSPNHRLLVANDRTALYFDEHEVLVAAKHLVAAKGVSTVDSVGTTYIHFMFDRHEVVLSNGAWTESFQPGDFTLKGMGNAQRNEIFELFPELKTEAGLEDYQAARRTLKRHEALLLVK